MEKEANLRVWFDRVDSDKTGSITAAQLKAALSVGNLDFSISVVQQMIRMYDFDRNGTMSFQEFVELNRFLLKVQQAFSDAERGRGYIVPDDVYETVHNNWYQSCSRMGHSTAAHRSEISEEMLGFKEEMKELITKGMEEMKELITKGVEEAFEKAKEAVRQSLAEWARESQTTTKKKMGTNYAGPLPSKLATENDEGGSEIEVGGEGTQAKEMSKLLPEPAHQVFDIIPEIDLIAPPVESNKELMKIDFVYPTNMIDNILIYKLHDNEYGKSGCKFDDNFENMNTTHQAFEDYAERKQIVEAMISYSIISPVMLCEKKFVHFIHYTGVINQDSVSGPALPNDVVDKYSLRLLYIVILVGVSAFVEGCCWTRTAERQASRTRMEYLRSVHRQEVGFLDNKDVSLTTFSVVSTMSTDAHLIQDVIAEKIPNCLSQVTALVSGILVAFLSSWRLALACLPFAIGFVVPGVGFGKLMMNFAMKAREAYGVAGGVAEQAISSIRTVYSYVGEHQTLDRFGHELQKSTDIGIKQGLDKGLLIGSMGIVFVAWEFIAWVGSVLVTKKGETGGHEFVAGISIVLEAGVGVGTVGSSEVIMLAGIAFNRKWQHKRRVEGKPSDKPNIVTGANVQVCWENFANYFEVELKEVQMREGYYVMYPVKAVELVDENTICELHILRVAAILGSTLNGEFKDVKLCNDVLLEKNEITGYDTSIHVDAASGGFIILVSTNGFLITGGQFLSYLNNLAVTQAPGTWHWMLSIAGFPALVQFVLMLSLPESPRWLYCKGREEEAQAILRKIYPAKDVNAEIQALKESVEDEIKETGDLENVSFWTKMKTLFQIKPVRRGLIAGMGLQVFQQFVGIKTVMYYRPTIVQLAGFASNQTTLLFSLVTSGLNALGSLVSIYFIDRTKKKKNFWSSAWLVL